MVKANDKVYIVIVSWGEYDDYTEQIEEVFSTKEKAELFISKQKNKSFTYKIQEKEIYE